MFNNDDIIWDDDSDIIWDDEPQSATVAALDKQKKQPFFKRAARTAGAYLRPTLEMGGMIAGGAIGTAAAPGVGSLAGAGLGYAGGRQMANLLEQAGGARQYQGLGREMLGAGRDVAVGGAMTALGPVAGKILQPAGRVVKQVAGSLLPKRTGLDKIIDAGIEKAIRPSVAGKATYKTALGYKDKAREAVKTIVKNKSNLNIVNDLGERTYKLPETLGEFSQAVNNAKELIFRQYDAIAKTGGQYGGCINLGRIAKKIEPVLKDPAIKDFFPAIARHARQRQTQLLNAELYTTTEAQSAIKQFNNSLNAYYKNPTPGTAGAATIDAMIANNLRKNLDNVIKMAARLNPAMRNNPGYQSLKNQYGALKTIEKDVNHRAVVEARKNTKGLLDFSDVFSGHQIVHGLLTMNPASMAAGGAAKGIASFYKYLNNPNTIIKKMFRSVAGSMESATLKSAIPGIASKSAGYAIVPEMMKKSPDTIDGLMSATATTAKAGEQLSSEQLGVKAYLDNDYQSALDYFRKAMKENPQNARQYTTAINQILQEMRGLKKLSSKGDTNYAN